MEKKKNSKNIKKNKKNTKNNRIKKVTKKKRTGFTLIELLAVIIILGVLMIIAIPAVTSYINDSRKSGYIDTAKNIISGTRNVVNEGTLEMYDTGVTYYIPVSYIKTENGTRTPYGDFTQAYVGVIYDGRGYKYYWISNDTSRQGIKNVTFQNNLDEELIEGDLNDIDIRTIVETTGIEGRYRILILGEDGKWEDQRDATNNVGSEKVVITYPEGKDKSTVEVGDIVKIKNEEFYVINNDVENDNLTLLAHYILNVGEYKINNLPEGLQLNGLYNNSVAYLNFSKTDYWNGKVGSGKQYPGSYSGTNYPYVYDSNSNLYIPVNNYKSKLERYGVMVKEARLLKYSEAYTLGCRNSGCSNAPAFIYEVSFWLGSASHEDYVFFVYNPHKIFGGYSYTGKFGVRPVIVI